ncbi:MAG: hypothetical protein K2X81_26385, partial [Candidatus Obscuribacterales bacterium]|nr:hypothetical protein [Candidatus Obscuribacterales bacterium]
DQSSSVLLANFNSVTRDKDGSILEIVNPKGDSRKFTWNDGFAGKKVSEIQDIRRTAKGDVSETWTRKIGTNDFVSIGKNGKEKIRENVQLQADGSGDYTYKNKDGGKDRLVRLGSDGGGDSALSENVAEARENLLEELKDKVPEVNYKRFQEMMQNFEKRMGDRASLRKLAGVKGADSIDDEAQKDVQGTYDNLRQMISKGSDGTFYDQKTRVKLAENFMFHAMEPTTIDQGPSSPREQNGHGTCWISSGQIWGMTQHPGAMADYLKQVTLNGQVTTKNSGEKDPNPKTYSFSSRLLSFPGGFQESKWTIESATTMWREEPGMKTEIIGDRSPVSKIFDYTLPILSGSRAEFDVDGGTYDTHNFVGRGHTRGTREILYMVTGDVPLDVADTANQTNGHLLNKNFGKSMAEKGSILNYEPGHLKSQTVRQVDGKWWLIQDNQHGEKDDRVIAQIGNIEAWAKGDRSSERAVNLSTLELLHKKKYVGSGSADALGAVTPRKPSNPTTFNGAVSQRQNPVRSGAFR